MTHIGLFEGIGGFSLAARMSGWKTLVTCEIEPFCQRVLRYHFPNAYHHGDIKTLTYETINAELSNRYATDWRREPIILTGGFPCQPYSTAGKRKGNEDDRHLWPEMLRVIREVSPEWVVGENVSGLISWSGGLVFEQVQANLEAEGYEVWPVILPACAVNAPHRRDRVWFIAHFKGYGGDRAPYEASAKAWRQNRHEVKQSSVSSEVWATTHTKSNQNNGRGQGRFLTEPSGVNVEGATTNAYEYIRCERGLYQEGSEEAKRHLGALDSWDSGRTWENFPTQPPICGRNDGFPGELDGITLPSWRNNTIKAFGNAIVPQIAYQLFQVINKLNNQLTLF